MAKQISASFFFSIDFSVISISFILAKSSVFFVFVFLLVFTSHIGFYGECKLFFRNDLPQQSGNIEKKNTSWLVQFRSTSDCV